MHSLIKSVKPEIVNRYDLWVLRHKIGGAKQVFVNNVQWSDQIPIVYIAHISLTLIIWRIKVYLSSKYAKAQSFSMFVLSIFTNGSKGSH